MKLKVFALAIVAILIYSCGSSKDAPKVTVGAQKPDTVQVPEKVASPNESPTMSTVVAEGKILYENKCAACHRLFSPSEYSKEDWPPILLRMQKKAHIEDADMAKINSYVYANL